MVTQNLLSDRQGGTWTGDVLDIFFASLTLSFGSCLATEILYALYLLLDTVLRLANHDSLGLSQSSD